MILVIIRYSLERCEKRKHTGLFRVLHPDPVNRENVDISIIPPSCKSCHAMQQEILGTHPFLHRVVELVVLGVRSRRHGSRVCPESTCISDGPCEIRSIKNVDGYLDRTDRLT